MEESQNANTQEKAMEGSKTISQMGKENMILKVTGKIEVTVVTKMIRTAIEVTGNPTEAAAKTAGETTKTQAATKTDGEDMANARRSNTKPTPKLPSGSSTSPR